MAKTIKQYKDVIKSDTEKIKDLIAKLSVLIASIPDDLVVRQNRKLEITTAFGNFDQKVNQLFNLIATVHKNEKEMKDAIARNVN
jgi:hypothetical protein